jgi:type IV pilus assembly protein PilW
MRVHVPLPAKARSAGFTLVEVMIAITLGLIVVAGLTVLFVNNSRAHAEIEQVNRKTENGRYAIQLMTEDIWHAGFFAELNTRELPTPAAKPDPCAVLPAELIAAMPMYVQGYDNGADPALSCLSDVRPNTDILVIRRVGTCFAGATGCDAVIAGAPYFQVSRCNNASELGSGNIANFFKLDTDSTNLTLTSRNCTNAAGIRRYVTHIYFIANNDVGSDGIPTLKRAELTANAAGTASTFRIVPLVEGVENLHIEYGMDTDANGRPDSYTADVDSFDACTAAACIENWRKVVAAKLNVLARNSVQSQGYTDPKTYTLGLKANGDANTVAPGGAYKRQVFQATVAMPNPAGRLMP